METTNESKNDMLQHGVADANEEKKKDSVSLEEFKTVVEQNKELQKRLNNAVALLSLIIDKFIAK